MLQVLVVRLTPNPLRPQLRLRKVLLPLRLRFLRRPLVLVLSKPFRLLLNQKPTSRLG